MAANMIALGAAYQRGVLLVDATNIEEAITLNGVAVTMNQNAFRLGRVTVCATGMVGRRASSTYSAACGSGNAQPTRRSDPGICRSTRRQ